MAYRVTSNAAIGSADLWRRRQAAARPRGGDRAQDRVLARNATLSGVALSCLVLAASGVLLLGRAHDPGSLPDYTASRKSLKIALVEPPAQAQMEHIAIARATPPSAPFGPDVGVKTAKVEANPRVAPPPAQMKLAHVPVPKARPHKADATVLAKVPTPRERVVEKAPELSAPIEVAALDISASETTANAVAPSPQPSPPRGEDVVASVEAPNDAVAETADTPDTAIQSVKTTEVAEAPVPTTFGPPRLQPSFTLTSYAPTREQVFDSDVTGSTGNPWRGLGETRSLASAVAPSPQRGEGEASKPAPETTKAISRPHDYQRPPKLARPRAPSIQEKLWGPSVRLASLTPMDSAPKTTGPYGIPTMPYDRYTAVYVITHKKVYMPDGTVLDAHSGLGPRMDDPDFVRIRMHGATPPHVYDLRMREALFHGVEAIRMLPIGGPEAIFGRDGILAHTYMLGPSGQSNGCISFKDYDTFLDAFKAGKINRIAVLAKLD